MDRLLEILREMENEKNDKDRKISELERYMHTQIVIVYRACISIPLGEFYSVYESKIVVCVCV